MSEKRRDCKGRILRTGESQRQDGRYMYKYYDYAGKAQYLYSWKLEGNDKMPNGKPEEPSLREKIRMLQYDLEAGIAIRGSDMTVYQLALKYIQQKTGVRHNTRVNYNFVLNIIQHSDFGSRLISNVRLSDAKGWLIQLQQEGKGYSTIHAVRGVIRPAFQMAVDDDLIRKNPFSFQLSTIVVNDSVTREAISRKQERAFLEFVKNDDHFHKYYDGIYVLFKTGLRISEFTGLTLSDIDMEHRTITVNSQLQRTRDMKYVIERPKTESGIRIIPMADGIYECFQHIIATREKPKTEPKIGEKCGFLYLDKNGNPLVALHWEKYFQHICQKYNRIYRVPMPKVMPHVCRHTYCSNMARSGMNPKTLQYLMGHSDISVTLNIYTHVNLEDIEAECRKIHHEEW